MQGWFNKQNVIHTITSIDTEENSTLFSDLKKKTLRKPGIKRKAFWFDKEYLKNKKKDKN